ncbi:MAG: hypothetical protein ACYDCQ_21065 [Dehalococcoidia bacterium]
MKQTIETTTMIAISTEDAAEVTGYFGYIDVRSVTLPDMGPGKLNERPYNTDPALSDRMFYFPRFR